jgi:uncharacterized protein (DUF1697 family)
VKTWIALFRGINVGGNQPLPMKDLAALCERAGFRGVRTYVQSGNVVFQCSKGTSSLLGERIAGLVLENHGFQPKVIVVSVSELEKAAAENPFAKAESDPKSLHLCFLAELPGSPDIESLNRLRTSGESFVLKGKVFYLHTPHGFGASKLAARAERFIGVGLTARNWRTVIKLLELARSSV